MAITGSALVPKQPGLHRKEGYHRSQLGGAPERHLEELRDTQSFMMTINTSASPLYRGPCNACPMSGSRKDRS